MSHTIPATVLNRDEVEFLIFPLDPDYRYYLTATTPIEAEWWLAQGFVAWDIENKRLCKTTADLYGDQDAQPPHAW